MCAGALIASQGLITATLVREGHYIRMPLCLSIDRQMQDDVCKCFSAPYPTPPEGKYVTLNWLKHDCAWVDTTLSGCQGYMYCTLLHFGPQQPHKHLPHAHLY